MIHVMPEAVRLRLAYEKLASALRAEATHQAMQRELVKAHILDSCANEIEKILRPVEVTK